MNKLIPSAALLLAAATPLAQAQSSVSVYGVLDAGITRADNGTSSLWRLDSGAGWGSRLGFRGTEDLGGGLKANFLLEQGLDISTGTLQQGGAGFGRSAWLSLGTDAWEIRAGRQLSPVALSLLAVDPGVGNYWGNLQSTGIGSLQSPTSVAGDPGHQSTARINNALLGRWTTGPVTVRGLVAPGESSNPKGAGNYHGANITYQAGNWVATAGYSRFRQYAKDITGGVPDSQGEWTLGASYNFGPVRLAGGYYVYDPSEQNKVLNAATLLKTQSAWVGGTIPLSNGQVLLQVIRNKSERIAGVADGTATIFGATYEYFVSKRTVAYVSGGIVRNNATSNTVLVGSTVAVAPSRMGADPKAITLGIRHSF